MAVALILLIAIVPQLFMKKPPLPPRPPAASTSSPAVSPQDTGTAGMPQQPVLRAYLRRWKWEVGQFFEGVGPDSPSEEFARIAGDHPVFRISP